MLEFRNVRQFDVPNSAAAGIDSYMIQRLSDVDDGRSAVAEPDREVRDSSFPLNISSLRAAISRHSVRQVLVASLFCLLCAILLYRRFPEFLLQHHDGMHAYALLQTLHNWSRFAVGATVTPIEGMATFSYPLNLYLSPHLWPFVLLRDPNSRIFWVYVCSA